MEINASWSDFKSFIMNRSLSTQWFIANGSYYLFAIDGQVHVTTQIPMDGSAASDQTDFETNYKPNGNQSPTGNVRTQFEQVSYLLQMSNISALNVALGDSATITIQIPGTFNGVNPPSNGRYIDEGEAWFYPGADGDKVTSIVISDNDNLLGYGAGTVLGTYHDAQVPDGNQGWALHPIYPTEVSTLGWYGFIPSGMYLSITVQRSSAVGTPNGNFYCNLKWGMRTS